MKREDYINWDEFGMGLALVAAQRSKDPSTQVGACILDKRKRVLGVGYNGFPTGCSDDVFPWSKTGETTKYLFVSHAESNLILSCDFNRLEGSILYTTLYPCNECAKTIIQVGIRDIVYLHNKYKNTESGKAARRMFKEAGVTTRRFASDRSGIELKF